MLLIHQIASDRTASIPEKEQFWGIEREVREKKSQYLR